MSTRRSKRIVGEVPAAGDAIETAVTRTTVITTVVTKVTVLGSKLHVRGDELLTLIPIAKKAEPKPPSEGASTNTSAKSNGGKRKRANNDIDEGKSRTYAPPEKYAHLNGVPDAIDHGLVLLLVGLNPGVTTATVGHAYVFVLLYTCSTILGLC